MYDYYLNNNKKVRTYFLKHSYTKMSAPHYLSKNMRELLVKLVNITKKSNSSRFVLQCDYRVVTSDATILIDTLSLSS